MKSVFGKKRVKTYEPNTKNTHRIHEGAKNGEKKKAAFCCCFPFCFLHAALLVRFKMQHNVLSNSARLTPRAGGATSTRASCCLTKTSESEYKCSQIQTRSWKQEKITNTCPIDLRFRIYPQDPSGAQYHAGRSERCAVFHFPRRHRTLHDDSVL